MNLSHLNALELRLSHERDRLAKAKTEKEKYMRGFFVAQIEKEITGERKFLGLNETAMTEISDDELLALLQA